MRCLNHLFAVAITAGLRAADPIPLEPGSYWIYADGQSGENFEMRVGQPVWTQAGHLYHYLTGYSASPAIVRIDGGGNLVALDVDTGRETVLAGLAARPDEWWDAPGRECPQQGQTQERRVDYAGPGGRWPRAIEVKYRAFGCADAGVESEVFAGNIGMLRRVVNSIAGPKTFDLVYARIGNQIIETGDRARFSVAFDPQLRNMHLRVTLRIDMGYQPSIRLRFGSAQEFDVVLRNANGSVVWRWSDGKTFETGEREKRIPNVWTEVVEIARPAGELSGYTVEGWLATLPGEAKFAATAPLPPALAAVE